MYSQFIYFAFVGIGLISLCKAQFYKDYTTNMYGRQSFQCYTCTNNADAANSRAKYQQASEDCGFSSDFKSNSPYVQRTPCYTYCLKRETGIVGSKIDVERRCEPNCQEYNGNTRMKYLIDKVSCCVGNLCNKSSRPTSFNTIYLFLVILFTNMFTSILINSQ